MVLKVMFPGLRLATRLVIGYWPNNKRDTRYFCEIYGYDDTKLSQMVMFAFFG